jgi:hypothetical protein
MAILTVVLPVRHAHDAGPGGQTVGRTHSAEYEAGFYGAHPGLNAETGEWEDGDGTPDERH